MSLIALLLSLSDLTAVTLPSSSSNTEARADDTVASASPAPPSPPSSPAPSWFNAQAPAPAESASKDEFAAHPVTIEARLGIGSPTGILGGALSYSPVPAIGLDCGAGSNEKGLQLACGLRGRLILDSYWRSSIGATTHALTLTSGFSTGAYLDDHALHKLTWVDGPGPASRSYQRAYWWNTDLGVEERYETVVFRFFVGAALLLNPEAGVNLVTGSGEQIEPPTTSVGYFGFGVGFLP